MAHELYLSQSEALEFKAVSSSLGGSEASVSERFEAGECPWCDEGPFTRPKMHARQKHEAEWSSYSVSE